jgi:hypothetical protein
VSTTEPKGGDVVADQEVTAGPLVFISHDSRDAAVAEAFSKLLSSVTAGMLKTFRSSDKKGSQGFEYGVEWYPELMKKIDSASDVVCLLTANSLERPWILYEAGVAKGKLDIPVHGLAVGVPLSKVSVGPFAQFQNCDDDVDSLTKLVSQLIRRLPNADPEHETVRSQVELFRSRVQQAVVTSARGSAPEQTDEISPAKLFEEIKVMFQDLPARLEPAVPRTTNVVTYSGTTPALSAEEITRLATRSDLAKATKILILLSTARDSYPWLYEMGVEVYRASLDESLRGKISRRQLEAERKLLLALARTRQEVTTKQEYERIVWLHNAAADIIELQRGHGSEGPANEPKFI